MSVLVISLLLCSAPAVALLAYVVHSSRQKKNSSRLPLNLVGRVASVERALAPEGFVMVEGELWRARVSGVESIERGGQRVRVVGASGCVLLVEPHERTTEGFEGEENDETLSRNARAAFLETSGAASVVARELL